VRHYRPIPAALLLLMAVVFSAHPLNAQTLSGLEQGIKPYGSYDSGGIDSIGLANGSVTLHIPLVSYPQRGGRLHLGFNVYYNAPLFVPQAECGGYPVFHCSSEQYYLLYQGLTQNGTWGSGAPAIEIRPDFVPVIDGQWANPGGYVTKYSLADPDGARHLLGTLQSNPGPNFISLDATGFIYNNGDNEQSTTGEVWDKSGITYGIEPTSTVITDTNGNTITSNSSRTSWTDTLGRTIADPSAATPTSDYTGCKGTQSTSSAKVWSVPGPNGTMMQFKMCYASFPISYTPADCVSVCHGVSTPVTNIQSIVLPNGTAWIFEFDTYGALSQITTPLGGSISYTTTATSGPCVGPNNVGYALGPYGRAVTTRTVSPGDGSGPYLWTYAIGSQTIVTDPLGNDAVHTAAAVGSCSFYDAEVDQYQGSHSGGTLLRKTVTTYNHASDGSTALPINVVPLTITTTTTGTSLSATSEIVRTYDSGVAVYNEGAPMNAIFGDVLTDSDYDNGSNGSPGPLLRKTTTSYLALSNQAYMSANLLDIPSSVQVTDVNGVQRAYTTYGYDEAGSPAGPHGNLTSTHRWLSGSTVSTPNCSISVSNGYLVSYSVYNTTGTVDHSVGSCGSSASDPNHKTTYGYASPCYAGSGPTSVTNSLNQVTSNCYDANTGLLISTTDPNGRTTSFTYDNMWRIVSASYPDGGSSTIAHQEVNFPFSATLTKVLNSSQSYQETNFFDGFGRVTHHELVSDPHGPVYTDTTYDAFGRTSTVTNPYRSTSDSTYGLAIYSYDPLNRTILVTKPDNARVTTAYCGPATLVTDEAGHWRRSTSDALGRLIEVDEPNSPTAAVNSNGCPQTGDPTWVTTYGHDALDDLTSVVQGGQRNRTFVYDSLKELTSSTNPEVNAPGALQPVAYTYDADGNVITKTDTRSITTTYSYDALNRPTGMTYSNGDHSVAETYDQATCIGQSPCYNIGRRTTMTDAGGTEILSYDPMGREWGEQRTTNNVTKTTTYKYDLAGDLTTLTYPSGRIVTYTYDSAERPSDAQDVANSINYVTGSCANGAPSPSPSTGACYAPQGSAAQLQDGTNLVSTYIYNDRLQPCWMYATTGAPLATNTACTATDPGPGNILDLQYTYNLGSGDNGNVIGIANKRDTTRSQSFAYDQVNRILSGQTSTTSGSNCWGEAYSYDQWANLQSVAYVSGYTGCTQEGTWSLTATGNNQLPSSAATYDASGNVLNDNFNIYQWNAESEIKNAAGVNYTYDGDGDRLEKSNGKLYWYGAGTEILDESDLSGNFTNEYVFFGGKRVAMRNVSTGTIYYYAEDMLGSSRTMVQAGQTSVCYDADFYPFGGERDVTASCTQNYKFEGKERDSETQNDDFGARYYSWRVGRWLSADWSAVPAPVPYANLTNPQTLNLYAMVSDNPETFADLDGHGTDPVPPQPPQPTPPPPPPPPPAQQKKVLDLKQDIVTKRKTADNCDQACQASRGAAWAKLVADLVSFGALVTDGRLGPEAVELESAAAAKEAAAESVPESIPAGPSPRPTAAQQGAINEMGDAHGCSTCGARTPGTKSGNWVGDHQPSTALNRDGGPQVYRPQCLQCSNRQGGQVAAQLRREAAAAAAAANTPQ
jgi:RHS repeat-associated protein